ncbi:MAG: hypothetical protein Tsb0021_07690 [Chlamydiales bacterium]
MATNDYHEEELSEEDFIQEKYSKNPLPFWIWLFIFIVIISLIFGFQNLYQSYISQSLTETPFTQVTNRDFSLFLWQNPQFMRAFSRDKVGYLVGFRYQGDVTLEPGFEEKFVIAPPEVLFRYHVWNRLLKSEFPNREIDSDLFMEFLEQVPEWKPENWKNAPTGYRELVEILPFPQRNLADMPFTSLPLDVRIAYQGWLNFYREGDEINDFRPTYRQLEPFISKFRHYDRSYWRNIVSLDYLEDWKNKEFTADEVIPNSQMSPFLKVALFNANR